MHCSVAVLSQQNPGTLPEGGESSAGPGNVIKWRESKERSEGTQSNFLKIVLPTHSSSQIAQKTSLPSYMLSRHDRIHWYPPWWSSQLSCSGLLARASKAIPVLPASKRGCSPWGKDQVRTAGLSRQEVLRVRANKDTADVEHPFRQPSEGGT